MSIKRYLPILTVTLLVPVLLYSLSMSAYQKKMLPQTDGVSYILPTPFLKITALEFDGLASDFFFFNALTFYGEAMMRKERPRVKETEWEWMVEVLNASTDLDPYFFDPYYFANSILTWDAKMPEVTNILLAKGSYYRDWDWMIPFFMGFNEFYFLENNAKAAEYIMVGAKRPNAPVTLTTLGTRLAYKGNRTKIAIAFILESLRGTKDKVLRKELETRLKALQAILALEKAVEVFKERNGSFPKDLNELQSSGIVARIPQDPYGGTFYVNGVGAVKTTSDLRYSKKKN